MAKILSQSGVSLADQYNVVGSVAGIETLESEEVRLSHNMADVLFSERLSGGFSRIIQNSSQSTFWDRLFDLSAVSVVRVMNVICLTNEPTRIAHCQVSVRDDPDGRETPIWIWDAGPDISTSVRIEDDAAGPASTFILRPGVTAFPSMLLGVSQNQPVNMLAFRGVTNAFGAGSVNIIMIAHIQFAQVAGISSRGVKVPSW